MSEQSVESRAGLGDYLTLCKPRVVLLMLLCATVGMLLAVPSIYLVPPDILVFCTLGIALMAGSAATVNHLADAHIDARMARTCNRPVVVGRISPRQGMAFAAVTGIIGMVVLVVFVNPLTAMLNLISWIGYGIVYTFFLKRTTSQNIVIGGLFGAAPPLFGWAAITNSIEPEALLLVLIIFVWTPPHFWALALDRRAEYAKADVPMLPVTHGEIYTKWFIFFYTWLLFATTLLPFAVGMSRWIYLVAALALGGWFLWLAGRLLVSDKPDVAMIVFRYSIKYLLLLFIFLLLDHYLLPDALPLSLSTEPQLSA